MKSVRVLYLSGRHGQSDTDYERSFATVEEAKKTPPIGDGNAFISVEGGTYLYSGHYREFGWQFFPKAA